MSKSILIVDDAAFMRITLRKILEGNNYTVAGEAENGQQAIEKYKELKPDLVIMDITMPEKGGLIALREIKAYDPDAKIIMCSAMGQQAMVVDAIQGGAKDFIVKPFQASGVLAAINRVLV